MKPISFARTCLMALLLTCFFAPKTGAQTDLMHGKVIDTENLPLVGASVRINGTLSGAMTDAEGNFSIPFKGDKNLTLTVSYTPM